MFCLLLPTLAGDYNWAFTKGDMMNTKHYQARDTRIRWAYLFEEIKPAQTSTCALFWRTFVLTPLKLLAILGAVTLLGIFMLGALGNAYPALWLFGPPLPTSAEPMPMAIKVILATLVAKIIGERVGLWKRLGKYCYPVEIEGCLVKKGNCPRCGTRPLVLYPAGHETFETWDCATCGGYFIPSGIRTVEDDAL